MSSMLSGYFAKTEKYFLLNYFDPAIWRRSIHPAAFGWSSRFGWAKAIQEGLPETMSIGIDKHGEIAIFCCVFPEIGVLISGNSQQDEALRPEAPS